MKPFPHQEKFSKLWGKQRRVLNFDACGTGKTIGTINAVKENWPTARVLVLGPLSILESAWGEDLSKAWPDTTVAIASGGKQRKLKAIQGDAQWVITNHDTIKMIAQERLYSTFDVLVVDEADAFRNESQRTKALRTVSQYVDVVNLMTGTPTPKSITDVFNLALTVDFGERLGKRFTSFRKEVCNGYPIHGAPPGAMRWEDKPESHGKVMAALADITTRTTLEDVTDLPETIYRKVYVTMPKKLQSVYKRLEKESVIDVGDKVINSVNASARVNKLLQTVAGAVYDADEVHDIHPERHELAVQLALETDHALIAFNWKHQRDGLIRELERKKVDFAVIDGEVSPNDRSKIVKDFENKRYRVLLVQPQSAGHGLTLVAANRVVWASPTYRTDLFEQINHRIVRNGQKRKTEILMVAAHDSVEEIVYEKQFGKRTNMFTLLDAIAELAKAA